MVTLTMRMSATVLPSTASSTAVARLAGEIARYQAPTMAMAPNRKPLHVGGLCQMPTSPRNDAKKMPAAMPVTSM